MNTVGIQFDRPSKVQYYDAGELELALGDNVIVPTDDGHILGRVVLLKGDPRLRPPNQSGFPQIVRKAQESDLAQLKRNRRRELDAFAICQKRLRATNVPVKLVKAQFTLGGGKVTYYFSAENRVDFRHLTENLTQELGMKVEMQQVGVRDATGMLGGIGICGREYCCSTFLTAFKPISIKMAKIQNLSLNPEKVSGGCGRLRCCLQYELDIYHDLGKDLPKVGKRVLTPQGPGKVRTVEILRRKITVELADDHGDQVFSPEEVELEKNSKTTEPESPQDNENSADD